MIFRVRNIDRQGIVSNYSSSEDDKDTRLESDIKEPGDDKRDIAMKKEVRKKILNQQELNVTTVIITLNTISEEKNVQKNSKYSNILWIY